ncbi:hypothetical protein [Dactylosporangium sp. NPDC000521]|uniref:hypothetical protein n=1 Tax=Dactylosporangium sp. NPDC000521 TaxID=3363975 RepID=UPI0036C1AAC1
MLDPTELFVRTRAERRLRVERAGRTAVRYFDIDYALQEELRGRRSVFHAAEPCPGVSAGDIGAAPSFRVRFDAPVPPASPIQHSRNDFTSMKTD